MKTFGCEQMLDQTAKIYNNFIIINKKSLKSNI